MPLLSAATRVYLGRSQPTRLYLGSTLLASYSQAPVDSPPSALQVVPPGRIAPMGRWSPFVGNVAPAPPDPDSSSALQVVAPGRIAPGGRWRSSSTTRPL